MVAIVTNIRDGRTKTINRRDGLTDIAVRPDEDGTPILTCYAGDRKIGAWDMTKWTVHAD